MARDFPRNRKHEVRRAVPPAGKCDFVSGQRLRPGTNHQAGIMRADTRSSETGACVEGEATIVSSQDDRASCGGAYRQIERMKQTKHANSDVLSRRG